MWAWHLNALSHAPQLCFSSKIAGHVEAVDFSDESLMVLGMHITGCGRGLFNALATPFIFFSQVEAVEFDDVEVWLSCWLCRLLDECRFV